MEGLIKEELVDVIQTLLPGFLSAWVFYGMTAYRKPNTFERTVQALIFSLFVQILTAGVRELICFLSRCTQLETWWSDEIQLACSMFLAILLGAFLAVLANNNTIHRLLICRNWRFQRTDHNRSWTWTKQSAYPGEWYRAFNEGPLWVVLHLNDRRRLYGKALEWPNYPDSGHFLMAEAEWLVDETSVSLENVWATLIPATEVVFVDFVAPTTEG